MASGKEEYSDIFNRPHHVSRKHPQMSRLNRAAQFSPFAALTGYDASVEEAARTTDRKLELGEDDLAVLNERLRFLQDHLAENPVVTITYFEPDTLKDGGAYLDYTGQIQKINGIERTIVCRGGSIIAFEDIISIKGDLYRLLELEGI